MWFVLVGVVICISPAISVPIVGNNNTYVLAKVLFYKDTKGQIMVANGPVPSMAKLAIRDDINSRIKDTFANRVKVVSLYNESRVMPKLVNIYQVIKNEQKPVFVTEVKKTRNTIKDWWDNLWGLNKKKAGRNKKKMTVNYIATSLPGSNSTIIKTRNADKNTTQSGATVATTDQKVTSTTQKNSEGIQVHSEKTYCPHCTTELSGKNYCPHCTTEISGITNEFEKVTDKTDLLNSLEADDFIPNDIFYSVEKRCVNWSDICDIQTGDLLNMSTSNFNYFRQPIFSHSGSLME